MSSFHLAELAEASYARHGDHDALLFEGRTWRSGELRERTHRAGAGLRRLGVAPGERVVVLMANCAEVGITYQAIWRTGGVVTPVVFLASPAELHHIVVDADAVAIVTNTELLGKVLEAAVDAPALRHIVVVGDVPAEQLGDERLVPFTDLEADASDAVEIVPRADDDLAALLYTGGTTGRAKGVMLSHRNLWWVAKNAQEAAYVPGITRTLLPLPLSHVYGLVVTIVGLHAVEPGLSVLQRWFDPVAFVALAAEHRIERSAIVPSMAQSLLAQPLEQFDLSAWRYVTCGAAPLAPEVLAEFERRVPGCELHEAYGLTESAAVISGNVPGARRIGSVGRAVPGVEVRIVDDDDDAEVLTGTDGEICARSTGMMQGYWHAPDETAYAMRGGWLHTGDIGHLDADGYLYVVDRKKDIIIRGGFNIYPRDIEDVLVEHPAVAMAGVVGRPHPTLGEEAVAFVSLRPGAEVTPDELVAFVKERMAATKYPREVHIVDAIPITTVGKLDRKALRARLG